MTMDGLQDFSSRQILSTRVRAGNAEKDTTPGMEKVENVWNTFSRSPRTALAMEGLQDFSSRSDGSGLSLTQI